MTKNKNLKDPKNLKSDGKKHGGDQKEKNGSLVPKLKNVAFGLFVMGAMLFWIYGMFLIEWGDNCMTLPNSSKLKYTSCEKALRYAEPLDIIFQSRKTAQLHFSFGVAKIARGEFDGAKMEFEKALTKIGIFPITTLRDIVGYKMSIFQEFAKRSKYLKTEVPVAYKVWVELLSRYQADIVQLLLG